MWRFVVPVRFGGREYPAIRIRERSVTDVRKQMTTADTRTRTFDVSITAAGHGAVVARTLLTGGRRQNDNWTEIEDPYDSVRREAELADEWRTRDRRHDWFDSHDEPEELTKGTVESLREADVDEALGMYLDETEIERETRRGQHRIAEHLDVQIQLETISDEQILDYVGPISSDPVTREEGNE